MKFAGSRGSRGGLGSPALEQSRGGLEGRCMLGLRRVLVLRGAQDTSRQEGVPDGLHDGCMLGLRRPLRGERSRAGGGCSDCIRGGRARGGAVAPADGAARHAAAAADPASSRAEDAAPAASRAEDAAPAAGKKVNAAAPGAEEDAAVGIHAAEEEEGEGRGCAGGRPAMAAAAAAMGGEKT